VRFVVGAVMVRTKPVRVLVLRRVGGDEYGGIEELPSGAVEGSETLGQALQREVLEETGIRVRTVGRFLFDFVYPSRSGTTAQLNFLVPVPDGATVCVDSREHVSYRWLASGSVAHSDLTGNVKTLLLDSLRHLGTVAEDR
jgi:8-oxo-dGTP diphosphatase